MATPVIMPRQGQSVESCILVEWLVKVGDKVDTGAPLANIETDKAVFEVESPAAGTVLDLFFGPGSDVPVLTHIAAIGNPGEDVAALRPGGAVATPAAAATPEVPAAPAAAQATASAAAATGPAAPTTASGVSPRARKTAERTGVGAESLAGSGPGGRVIERDVLAAAAAAPRVSPAARQALAAAGTAAPAAGTGPGGMVVSADVGRAGKAAAAPVAAAPAAAAAAVPAQEAVEVPLSTIRKIIAQRMHASLATTAQLTLHRTFDATSILAYRARVKEQGEALGLPNITINDMIVYVVARMLVKHPDLNAHFLGTKIVKYARANVGVAMDTPRGLMVPVLRAADTLSLSETSRRLKPIADAARQGSINPDLLSGGTFTVTNMGMLGIETFTPVINVPEVAILGVGGLILKPVSDGKGGVRHVQAIPLSLTIDHQAVDGGPGARFLAAVAESLESFELSLAQ